MTMSMSLFRYAAETPAFQVEHTCGNTLQPPSVLTLLPSKVLLKATCHACGSVSVRCRCQSAQHLHRTKANCTLGR